MPKNEHHIAMIESTRRINRSVGAILVKRGLEPIDVAIAGIYAAHDLAMDGTGEGPISALEWMRTALDVMELQLLSSCQ